MKKKVKNLSFDDNLVVVEEHFSGDDHSCCTSIFFDFDNKKIFSQDSFYEKSKYRWTFKEPKELTMEEFLNNRTEFEKRVFKKSFQINRMLISAELFEMSDDYETILNLIDIGEDFSVDEFIYHNETDAERDMDEDYFIDSERVFKGYDIIFETEEKTLFLETEEKYLYHFRGFIEFFKDSVKDSNNFNDCNFYEIYESFDEHPHHIVKKFVIDGIKYVLSSLNNDIDETAILAIEYIKKYNIKISDPEFLEDLEDLEKIFKDEE